MVLFTRDGEQPIRRYIANKPNADLIEVRNGARFTAAELEAAHTEATRVLSAADVRASSGTNVQQNRVEVYVFDPVAVEAKLRAANVRLPAGVVLVGEGQTKPTAPPAAFAPDVVFLRQAPVDGSPAYPAALLEGTLVVVDGCLRLKPTLGETSSVPVWPPDYSLGDDNGVLVIRNGPGEMVARVGDQVQLGGGQIDGDWLFKEIMRQQPPANCPGPYWLTAPLQ